MTVALATLTVSSPRTLAEEAGAKPSREEFNTVYRAFREASESSSRTEAYELAIEALRIGEVVFGEESKV